MTDYERINNGRVIFDVRTSRSRLPGRVQRVYENEFEARPARKSEWPEEIEPSDDKTRARNVRVRVGELASLRILDRELKTERTRVADDASIPGHPVCTRAFPRAYPRRLGRYIESGDLRRAP